MVMFSLKINKRGGGVYEAPESKGNSIFKETYLSTYILHHFKNHFQTTDS